METEGELAVEVVYAGRLGQTVIALRVPPRTTVAEAIALSGLAGRYGEIGETPIEAGIYGRRVPLHSELAAGDRVEIYRPLITDAKQARRHRARKPA